MNHTTSIQSREDLDSGKGLSVSRAAMRRIFSRRLKGFAWFLGVLLLVFSWPLVRWIQFGAATSTYSYIILIPGVSAYLVWLKRDQIPLRVNHKAVPSVVLLGIATLLMVGYGWSLWRGWDLPMQDQVSVTTLALVLFFVGGVFAFLGTEIPRMFSFPFWFLLFMVPFPVIATEWIEIFFQYGSADAAHLLLNLTGTPVYRDGLLFELPGITLEVARDCSGIRSSLVLLISSLLAGHLMLNSTWRRVVLVVFIVPLGIFRNAFRILTIAMLCVHVSPDMVNSIIHRRGGPVFFALSLVPLFLLLWILKKTEHTKNKV